MAHLWLVENPAHRPQGDFTLLDNGQVASETGLSQGVALTFSGVGLYQPRLFSEVPLGEKAALAPILRQAMGQQLVTGQRLQGRWVDVGTPERLYELDEQLKGPSS
jgi:MurNAc alpha-1-phosphate uridylyltransferase